MNIMTAEVWKERAQKEMRRRKVLELALDRITFLISEALREQPEPTTGKLFDEKAAAAVKVIESKDKMWQNINIDGEVEPYIICVHGHRNMVDASFCMRCGRRII